MLTHWLLHFIRHRVLYVAPPVQETARKKGATYATIESLQFKSYDITQWVATLNFYARGTAKAWPQAEMNPFQLDADSVPEAAQAHWTALIQGPRRKTWKLLHPDDDLPSAPHKQERKKKKVVNTYARVGMWRVEDDVPEARKTEVALALSKGGDTDFARLPERVLPMEVYQLYLASAPPVVDATNQRTERVPLAFMQALLRDHGLGRDTHKWRLGDNRVAPFPVRFTKLEAAGDQYQHAYALWKTIAQEPGEDTVPAEHRRNAWAVQCYLPAARITYPWWHNGVDMLYETQAGGEPQWVMDITRIGAQVPAAVFDARQWGTRTDMDDELSADDGVRLRASSAVDAGPGGEEAEVAPDEEEAGVAPDEEATGPHMGEEEAKDDQNEEDDVPMDEGDEPPVAPAEDAGRPAERADAPAEVVEEAGLVAPAGGLMDLDAPEQVCMP